MSRIVFIALVVAALAGAEAVYYLVRYLGERRSDELKRRLRLVGEPGQTATLFKRRRLARSQALADSLDALGLFAGLEKKLEQTDLDMTVARLLVVCAGLAIAGGVAGLVLLRNPLLAALLAAAGAVGPMFWVDAARKARSRKVSEQLPDALEMMARSSRAGYALPATFKLIAQECPSPIAVEFGKAYEQQQFGVAFDQAVLGMTERVPDNLDLRLFAVSVLIQKETGGNLVEVLDNISGTLRERFKFFSKLRALTAEGKLSAIVMGCLPWGVAILILATNPGYLNELTQGIGRLVLLIGLTAWALGLLWTLSLTKVDY